MTTRTITITQLLLTLCFITGVALFTACSSENEPLKPSIQPKPEQPKEGCTQVKAGNLTFNISEMPFGADTEEETRTAQEPALTDTVELCEGVEAEIILERDSLPATRAVKQGMSDGNYRVFAYQNGVSKGMFTFIVSGGNVTFAGHLTLPPGVYSFYCCNEHVGVDNNKFTIPHSNVGGALIGFAKNVYVGGSDDQHISFAMTHVGGRIRTKVSALISLPGDMRSRLGIAQGKQSYDMTYNLATDQYQYANASPTPLPFPELGYTPTADVHDAVLNINLSTAMSNDYTYFVSHTPLNEIVIRFLNGSRLYNKPMNTFAARKLSSGTGMIEVNKSYILYIKLVPNFKYVFEDGYRRYLRDRGNHLPVALAFSDHLGIALKDAHPVGYPNELCPSPSIPIKIGPGWKLLSWTATQGSRNATETGHAISPFRNNKPEFPFSSWSEALSNGRSGRDWTWNPNCTGDLKYSGAISTSYLTPAEKVKGNGQQVTPTYFQILFPAFYWAGQYPLVKRQEGQAAGLGNLSGLAQELWFLPSANEWYKFLQAIGSCGSFVPVTPATQKTHGVANYNAAIINYALKKAGGTPLWDYAGSGYYYWTSSEFDVFPNNATWSFEAFTITPNADNHVFIYAQRKYMDDTDLASKLRVRAFVSF